MTYMAVKDLKRTRELWLRLQQEKELIITREGKPCAILIEVSADNLEDSLMEIRRALFSAAVTRARRRAQKNPPSLKAIEALVRKSRRERGIS